jgi:spore coat protein A
MNGDGVQEADEQFVLAPGDRADVVFDFSAPQLRGHSVTLLNYGPAFDPFKGLNPDGSLAGGVVTAQPSDSVGQVMRFNVGWNDHQANTATVTNGTVLDASYTPLLESGAAHTRKVGLFEGLDEFGRVTPTLGVAENTTDINGNPVPFGPLSFEAPATETPTVGTTEVWDIFNLTADAHPIHLHLTQFQVLARHEISFIDANDDGVPDNVRGGADITAGSNALTDDVVEGAALPLSAMDMGWQDTIILAPNQSISIIAPFDMAGDYVWHCHILSHEDHDMMRPYTVIAQS